MGKSVKIVRANSLEMSESRQSALGISAAFWPARWINGQQPSRSRGGWTQAIPRSYGYSCVAADEVCVSVPLSPAGPTRVMDVLHIVLRWPLARARAAIHR